VLALDLGRHWMEAGCTGRCIAMRGMAVRLPGNDLAVRQPGNDVAVRLPGNDMAVRLDESARFATVAWGLLSPQSVAAWIMYSG
jgi:hypothetical protein